MTEVLFYHLEHQPLERVLPSLVEKTLERGWRAVVQAGSEERVEALDTLLWTYREESFLPHGTKRDGNPDMQPVYLTTSEDNPNGATVRFLVDGAEASDLAAYTRVVYLFDGRDAAALDQARAQWKAAKEAGSRGHLLAAVAGGPLGEEGLSRSPQSYRPIRQRALEDRPAAASTRAVAPALQKPQPQQPNEEHSRETYKTPSHRRVHGT